jgi:hypothetical protein
MGRFSTPNLRAAWWAWWSARRTERNLRRYGLDGALELRPPPPLPAEAERGVRAALRRTEETCLVRSIVLQRWYAAHAEPRDLIIGVTSPDDEFQAHAWLEGEQVEAEGPFRELLRRPAR